MIKRYDLLSADAPYTTWSYIGEVELGEYVKYSDYQELHAKLSEIQHIITCVTNEIDDGEPGYEDIAFYNIEEIAFR
jgi:hypothetical protein